MRRRLLLLLVLGAVALSAVQARAQTHAARPTIGVFTQNLYVGFDVQTLLNLGSATSEQFVVAAAAAWQSVQASDPNARMATVAAEIAATKPDLVGLQEAATYKTSASGSYDFVALLVRALTAKGLKYTIVADSTNSDVTAPISASEVVRFTDHDVLLVRTGKGAKKLKITNRHVGHFADPTIVATPLGTIPFPRGWTSADMKLGTRSFHVVETHLEAFNDTRQGAQAHELIAGPAASKLPTLVFGDLNSNANPDVNQTETYPDLVAAGFVDMWPAAHPGDPGYTCCEQADLRNATPTLKQRIDLVLARGGFAPVSAAVVGGDPAARTASGLWPSDHAGVAMTLRLPR